MRIAIIGGGAGGLFCAVSLLTKLGKKDKIVIYEKNARVGQKILMAGNSKCNLSNETVTAQFYNKTPLIAPALTFDAKAAFGALGLFLRTDAAGRIYPYSEKATNVLNILRKALGDPRVEIRTGTAVKEIKPDLSVYTLATSDRFDAVVWATGSSAHNGNLENYDILQKLGIKLTKLRPALGPLHVKEEIAALSGLRVKAGVKVVTQEGRETFSGYGEVQFRAQLLSGIIIYDASRYVEKGDTLLLDLVPELSEEALLAQLGSAAPQAIFGLLPKALAEFVLARAGTSPQAIAHVVKHLSFGFFRRANYRQCQIVQGGVDKTAVTADFEAKAVPGLYFCGEILDVDGASGGYNLHFAWASAAHVATALARRKK